MRASASPSAGVRSLLAPAPAPLLADDADARSAIRASRVRTALAVVAGWTAYTLVMVGLYEAARIGPERTFRWSVPLMFSVGAYWALVTPLIAALTRRLAPARVGAARSFALHAAAALVVSLAAIAVRWLAFRVLMPSDAPSMARLVARLIDYQLILYALVAVLSAAVQAHRAYVTRAERALALGAQLAQARLEFLQRQLQPHFLFNALNAAAELTRESATAAVRVLGQLRRLFEAATACRAPEVPLRDELRVLGAYVDVQRARFGDALEVETRAAADALDAAVPPLLLQPLVENAIHHGLAARRGEGRVLVVAERAGDQLVLRVHDTGDPPPASGGAAPGRRHGIGLRNTEERLQRLYGDAGRLRLEHRDGEGTAVTVTIPLRPGVPAPVSPAAAGQPLAPGALPSASVELTAGDVPTPSSGVRAAILAGIDVAPSWVPDVSRRALAIFWLACAACWTAQTLTLSALSPVVTAPWWRVVLVELVSAALWVLLTPLVLWLGRHVRVRSSRWLLPTLAHVALGLVIGAVHLFLTYAISAWEIPTFTTGVVNPYTLDAVIYLGLVAWTHARDFVSWHRERGVAAARLEADLRHTRLQSLALDLRPAFVTSLLGRSAELVAEDPARAESVLESLADVLRALLDDPGRPPTVATEAALLEDCLALHALAGGRRLHVRVHAPRELMAAGVPAGAVRQVLDWVAADALEDADAVELVARRPNTLDIRAVRGETVGEAPAGARLAVALPD